MKTVTDISTRESGCKLVVVVVIAVAVEAEMEVVMVVGMVVLVVELVSEDVDGTKMYSGERKMRW